MCPLRNIMILMYTLFSTSNYLYYLFGLKAAELYRAVLRALRWCFVTEDFRDFICFDACLRDMVGISSISCFSGITVTAAIDQYRSACVEEYENEKENENVNGNVELDNEMEVVLVDEDDDDDDDEDDVEEEEEEEEVNHSNGIRIKRKYNRRDKNIKDKITYPGRRKSRKMLDVDTTNNSEDNDDNNDNNDNNDDDNDDDDENKNDENNKIKSDKDDDDEDDDENEVEKEGGEKVEEDKEDDGEEEEKEVKHNNGIRIKRKYNRRDKNIKDKITNPGRRKSRKMPDVDTTNNSEDNNDDDNDNKNDKNDNNDDCANDKDSDDDEVFLFLTDDMNERKPSSLQHQYENENEDKNETENKNENEYVNENENEIENENDVEVENAELSDSDDEVITLNSPNIKKKKKEEIVIRRCSLRLKE